MDWVQGRSFWILDKQIIPVLQIIGYGDVPTPFEELASTYIQAGMHICVSRMETTVTYVLYMFVLDVHI
jgi:hypothetical protein